ncbi:hypothetical protein BC940DRAFT_318087 [Gongronella butleri]|nr:hypothetical protein BC940DRAFT_318087 [Gongronella butleri]
MECAVLEACKLTFFFSCLAEPAARTSRRRAIGSSEHDGARTAAPPGGPSTSGSRRSTRIQELPTAPPSYYESPPSSPGSSSSSGYQEGTNIELSDPDDESAQSEDDHELREEERELREDERELREDEREQDDDTEALPHVDNENTNDEDTADNSEIEVASLDRDDDNDAVDRPDIQQDAQDSPTSDQSDDNDGSGLDESEEDEDEDEDEDADADALEDIDEIELVNNDDEDADALDLGDFQQQDVPDPRVAVHDPQHGRNVQDLRDIRVEQGERHPRINMPQTSFMIAFVQDALLHANHLPHAAFDPIPQNMPFLGYSAGDAVHAHAEPLFGVCVQACYVYDIVILLDMVGVTAPRISFMARRELSVLLGGRLAMAMWWNYSQETVRLWRETGLPSSMIHDSVPTTIDQWFPEPVPITQDYIEAFVLLLLGFLWSDGSVNMVHSLQFENSTTSVDRIRFSARDDGILPWFSRRWQTISHEQPQFVPTGTPSTRAGVGPSTINRLAILCGPGTHSRELLRFGLERLQARLADGRLPSKLEMLRLGLVADSFPTTNCSPEVHGLTFLNYAQPVLNNTVGRVVAQ